MAKDHNHKENLDPKILDKLIIVNMSNVRLYSSGIVSV